MRSILAGWSLLLIATGAAAELSPGQIVERHGSAVVLIEASGDDAKRQGTGFLVAGHDGAVATALHVIDGVDEVRVVFSDGTEAVDVAVRGFDVTRDLVVLVLPEDVAGARSGIELGTTEAVNPADKVIVISNPMGLEHTITEGLVSAWREPRSTEDDDASRRDTGLQLPNTRMLQISAAISPGSSGGPVLDTDGSVIGVASSGVLYGAAGLNFAVPADDLWPLLEIDDAMDLESFQEQADAQRLDLAEPHLQEAEFALERHEPDDAVRHLQRALRIYPRYADALVLAGSMAMERGDTVRAVEDFTAAVSADAESAEAWYRLGTALGRLAVEQSKPELQTQAEAAYVQAVDLDYRHAGAAYELALLLAARGLLEQAEELLLQAKQADPGLTAAANLLGEIYLKRGDTEAAKDAFNDALWADPDDALSHLGLARVYTFADYLQSEALEHWERFLELSENDPSLAETRAVALRLMRQRFPDLDP